MDEDKIIAENKYRPEMIYQTLERAFAQFRLRQEKMPDGTLFFYGSGNPRDYGAFGSLITTLYERTWFMEYVIKWIWYNSDNGRDETDFSVEDVLFFYTKRESAV